jgi:CheY-like chemotaxis protein
MLLSCQQFFEKSSPTKQPTTTNMIKLYVPNPNSITTALTMVLDPIKNSVAVSSIEDADYVLVTTSEDLREHHRADKFFGFAPWTNIDRELAKKQPENVFVMNPSASLLTEHPHSGLSFCRALETWMSEKAVTRAAQAQQPIQEEEKNLADFTRAYMVLVIDDTEENLQKAITRLPGHQLLLAKSPEDAMRLLNLGGKMPDAVLTDMQMPPDKTYGSLNLDVYGVTEKIHSGFAMMLEATKRGIPVAIVTDGNHHHDWASAMFDHIKEATVNGRLVLFYNSIGKNWDLALKELMDRVEAMEVSELHH